MIRFLFGFVLFLHVGDSRMFLPGEWYKHLYVAVAAILLMAWGLYAMNKREKT